MPTWVLFKVRLLSECSQMLGHEKFFVSKFNIKSRFDIRVNYIKFNINSRFDIIVNYIKFNIRSRFDIRVNHIKICIHLGNISI